MGKKSVTLEDILEKKQQEPQPKEKNQKQKKAEPEDTKVSETVKESDKVETEKVSTKRLATNLAVKVIAIFIVAWLAFSFIFAVTINYGSNMHPAIRDGELVVSLRLQAPYLNAAVLYEHDKKTCVGRVVALPGNTVEITSSGELKVNGAVAAEDIYYPTFPSENSDIKYPLTVEDGKVFILNDHREDTNDSRTFGTIDIKDTKGPIIFSFRRRGF